MKVRLLVSVVGRGWGDKVVGIAKAAGARGSTVFYGRGAAANRLLGWLCLADTGKEIIFTLGDDAELERIIAALRAAPDLCRKFPGFGIVLDVGAFFHLPNREAVAPSALTDKGPGMGMHELICVIANTGFADDIMHEARAAGAPGGTIIKARGTGREEDGSFFGITIVPEKEMVMILVRREKYAAIMQAVKNCPCLSEPGVGIVFSLPVEDFFPLGAAAK